MIYVGNTHVIRMLEDILVKIKEVEGSGSEVVPRTFLNALAFFHAETRLYYGGKRHMGVGAKTLYDVAEKVLRKYRMYSISRRYYKAMLGIKYPRIGDKLPEEVKNLKEEVARIRKSLSSGASIEEVFSDDRVHCVRCGRLLTNLKSVEAGMGPVCRRKHS